MKCDVLVIGSGAAGGVIAATLAELTDWRIILAEKGGYFDAHSFDQRELHALRLFAEGGSRTTLDGSLPVQGGECVGGGTTVNFALCFDPIESVWRGWRRDRGLSGLSFDRASSDYGISGLNIPRCLAHVRERINVHTVEDKHINDNNMLFALGCQRRGVTSKRFELNMRGCIACGYCGQGCAYDRKQGTMITYVADALQHGVKLIHHCNIERIEFASQRGRLSAIGASGVVRPTAVGSRPNSVHPGPIEIAARLVIISAGSIGSPALLQRSSYPDDHGQVGIGLVLHPSLPIAGIFDRHITNYRGITGSFYSDHYYRSHGFYYECLFDHPVYASIAIPRFADVHFETMLKYRSIAGFGVMLVDSVSPTNAVRWNPATSTVDITYRLSEPDKARLRFAAERGVEIMFAAGAREVLLTSEERAGPLPYPRFAHTDQAQYCSRLEFAPNAVLLTSAHCQSTVKMGEDRASSAIDSRCETHNASNLVVCDSSSFPTSCGSNPMVPIMTLARYQAVRIAGEARRYGLS